MWSKLWMNFSIGIPGHRVSIFLAVWDVHVQRAPVAGRIADVVYRPGQVLRGHALRAHREENEQNVINMDTPKGRLVFKQIAGAIARRVICWKRRGRKSSARRTRGPDSLRLARGYLAAAEAQIVVTRGQKVKGGESILAKWNSTT